MRRKSVPSVCDEELHGLLYTGSERILAGQQQQQLSRRELQQHACDFTGKRLMNQTREKTHTSVKMTTIASATVLHHPALSRIFLGA